MGASYPLPDSLFLLRKEGSRWPCISHCDELSVVGRRKCFWFTSYPWSLGLEISLWVSNGIVTFEKWLLAYPAINYQVKWMNTFFMCTSWKSHKIKDDLCFFSQKQIRLMKYTHCGACGTCGMFRKGFFFAIPWVVHRSMILTLSPPFTPYSMFGWRTSTDLLGRRRLDGHLKPQQSDSLTKTYWCSSNSKQR